MQHRGHVLRRAAAFLALIVVTGLDQSDQRLPRHHHLHLREKLLKHGLILGRGQVVIREAELLPTHHPRSRMRSQHHCRVDPFGFPESPQSPTAPRLPAARGFP